MSTTAATAMPMISPLPISGSHDERVAAGLDRQPGVAGLLGGRLDALARLSVMLVRRDLVGHGDVGGRAVLADRPAAGGEGVGDGGRLAAARGPSTAFSTAALLSVAVIFSPPGARKTMRAVGALGVGLGEALLQHVEGLLGLRAGKREVVVGRVGGGGRARPGRDQQRHPYEGDDAAAPESEPAESVEEGGHEGVLRSQVGTDGTGRRPAGHCARPLRLLCQLMPKDASSHERDERAPAMRGTSQPGGDENLRSRRKGTRLGTGSNHLFPLVPGTHRLPRPGARKRGIPREGSGVTDEDAYLPYIRHPHLHDDRVCFVAEDDVWLAPLASSDAGARLPGAGARLAADRGPYARQPPALLPGRAADRLHQLAQPRPGGPSRLRRGRPGPAAELLGRVRRPRVRLDPRGRRAGRLLARAAVPAQHLVLPAAPRRQRRAAVCPGARSRTSPSPSSEAYAAHCC